MKINKLTSLQVARAGPGRHGDGGGLALLVSTAKDGSLNRKWVFRFTRHGKPAECGMGGRGTTLAEARAKAVEAREQVRAGVNPVEAKRLAKREAKRPALPTFGECAKQLIAAKRREWRSAVHAEQWRDTINDYCKPILGTPVDVIDKQAVLGILQPIWVRIPETASRLRGRLEAIFDYAKAHEWRSGENPAAWRGNLAHAGLPKRAKHTRGHHPAMPYADVPAFLAGLRESETIPALALEFAILTAARSGEALGAKWSEFDTAAKVWTIQASRMKAGREHRVPLSSRAVTILERLAEVCMSEFVFSGHRRGQPLSRSGVAALVPSGATLHGFRSSFRDWCGNETSFPREVAEQALAHATGDATERAYRRADALEKRRLMMAAWASFLGAAPAGNVIALRA